MTNEQVNEKALDSWDKYIAGNFLKAINVQSENDPFVCVNVSSIIDKRNNTETDRVRLEVERNELAFEFDLNKENSKKLVELGVPSPRAMIGKKIYFKKALVRNPTTNKEVDSLRIWKVE